MNKEPETKEDIEKQIEEYIYHVVGMDYNTGKAMELKLKLDKMIDKDNKDE